MDLLSQAMKYAIDAHSGMRRKGNKSPYILHPMEAAAIVGSMTNDPEVLSAAVLHDVVEDAGVSFEELERLFGHRVMELVKAETEDKRENLPAEATWRVRKEESIRLLQTTTDIDIKRVFLGDKLANMRSFYREYQNLGDDMWQLFHQKDPAQHRWYYRSMADAMAELTETPAWKEYDQLIKILFREQEH